MAMWAASSFLAFPAYPQESDSIQGFLLEEVEVKARQKMPGASSAVNVALSSKSLSLLPRTFGEPDLIKLVAQLPGVSSSSDYASGLSIDGADFSQSAYTINNIPILYPYHFSGIYSTFNTEVYNHGTISRSATNTNEEAVVGGNINLETSRSPRQGIHASANIGMTASSVFISAPAGNLHVLGAARLSYISAIYGSMLGSKSTKINYDFIDVDLSPRWNFSPESFIEITFHHNTDRLGYKDINYAMDTRLKWSNSAVGITWHKNSSLFKKKIYAFFSNLQNSLLTQLSSLFIKIPNSAWQSACGIDCDRFFSDKFKLNFGARAEMFGDTPQYAFFEGFGFSEPANPAAQSSVLLRGYVKSEYRFSEKSSLDLTMGLHQYVYDSNYHPFSLLPSINFNFSPSSAIFLAFSATTSRQYYHYVGLSEIGMSTNFRLCADRSLPAQQSYTIRSSAQYSPSEIPFEVSAGVYYSRVLDAGFFNGSLLDLINNDFLAVNYCVSTSGFNTGTYISGSLSIPKWTASASYAFTVAKRKTGYSDDWFSSNSECPHSVKTSVSFHPNANWQFNALWRMFSGRPFTPAVALYTMGNRLMIEYGPRNSANFPTYKRLDISASFSWKSKKIRHLLSLAVLNVLFNRNVEIQTYAINPKSGKYYIKRVCSAYRLLPSVSYSISL